MLTIFTPTYNRAYTLPRLYESLCEQTSKDFTWLIVDDGSVDETAELIAGWNAENKISIRYYYQENQGKSAAHNKGVELTETELFTCVDSDDYLVPVAIERIIETWISKKDAEIIGIVAQKVDIKGTSLTSYVETDSSTGRLKELYDKKKILGDAMLVYESKKIKKYAFPKFENEKFVPEAYLYDLLDQEGVLYVITDRLYVAEYLEDGYSKSMAKTILKNANGYIAYIIQRLCFDKTLKEKFLDSIRYVGIALGAKKKQIIRQTPYPFICFIAFPFGYLFYWVRYRKLR